MASPLHIALIFDSYPPAELPGAAEVLALEAAGCRVTVVSLTPPEVFAEDTGEPATQAEVLYPPQLQVLEIAGHSSPQDAARVGGETAAPARLAWYFAGMLQRRGVQLIHVPQGKNAVRAAALIRLCGLPFTFAADAGLAAEQDFPAWVKAADAVFSSSDGLSAALLSGNPDAKQKILTVRPGIDASRYPAALCGGPGAMRVLFAAGESGTSSVMDAMSRLHAAGLEAELTLMPARRSPAETKRRLAAADVYLHGGGPDAGILEAMAAGLPVVATAPAGEMLHEGRTGWQVAPGATEALFSRLAALAESPALRSAAGHAGLERVQSAFSLSQRASRLASEFRRLLEGRFAPSLTDRPAGVLCLLESWPPAAADDLLAAELRHLATQPGVDLIASRLHSGGAAPPSGMEFLQDAPCIEAIWQRRTDLAAKALALRQHCPSVNGEDFLLHARRAVALAVHAPVRGWRHVHALRSGSLLTAWLLRRLTGMGASAVIEPQHPLPSADLPALTDAFRFGSSGDPAVSSPAFPNALHPAAPPSRRRMGIFSAPPAAPASVDVPAIWVRWLQIARSPSLPAAAE